jgi:hypothetical protein
MLAVVGSDARFGTVIVSHLRGSAVSASGKILGNVYDFLINWKQGMKQAK